MNIHHLELFYYVARNGGITEAVRHMPYGIQQPAVSSQILQLEATLGLVLFQRRPFSLTPAGQELFEFIKPFFGGLGSFEEKLRIGLAHHIRLGASEIVLRDHLPFILQDVRKRFPKLKVTLREGYQPELERWLQEQEIDMAVTVLAAKPPPGITSQPMLSLPLALLVGRSCRLKSVDELWRRDRIEETLVSLPANQQISRNFQEGLVRRGVDWVPGIEVSSLELIATYVATGNGLGLSVQLPGATLPLGVRMLPLEGFAPVVVGVLWQGKLSPLARVLLDEMEQRAGALGNLK